MVSAEVPKAICACAIAHKRQRVALHASSSQGVRRRAFLRSRCPCFARKTGAHRPWCARSPGRGFTGSPPIIRLAPVPAADARNPFRASSSSLFASLGAWLGERRPKNTNSKHSPFGPGLRLRPSLGSSKGIKKNQFKPTRHASRFTNFGPPSSVPGPCCISSLPPGTYNLLLSLSLSPHTFPPPDWGRVRKGAPHSSSTPSFSSIRTRRISGSPIRALGSSPSNRSSNVTPRPSTLTLPVQS